MNNGKMLGVFLGTLAFGSLVTSVRAEAPPAEKGKAGAKAEEKKGGQKGCGGANGCGADKSDKGAAASDKGKPPAKTEEKKGGQKSCGGANGCGKH